MPKTVRRILLTLLFPALLIVVLATGVIGAGNNQKLAVCHVTGNGSSHPISVDVHAVPAHMQHGDALADDYGDCP